MKSTLKGILFLLLVCAIVYAGIGTQPTHDGLVIAKASAANAPQKIVPIISAGQGIRIGGALVTGVSKYSLNKVVAVVQLEGSFAKSVRVRALVPVSSVKVVQKITRVPGASVIGLVDIKL